MRDVRDAMGFSVKNPAQAAARLRTEDTRPAIVPHPHPEKSPRQKIIVVAIAGYAYFVPFAEEDDHFFLKTVIPSRNATRDFITEGVRRCLGSIPTNWTYFQAYESGKLKSAASQSCWRTTK